MKIAMAPHRPVRNDNPYLGILTGALRRKGGVIVSPWAPLSGPPDVLHVHWLESPCWGRVASRVPLVARLKVSRVKRVARRVLARGGRVVWTAHNLDPHDFKSPGHASVYAAMRRDFLPLVTDVICMSEASKALVRDAFPELAGATFQHVRHPSYVEHFSEIVPASPPELQSWVSGRCPTIATFGHIRPYKDIPGTVRLMKRVQRDFRFVIAGRGPESEMSAILREIGDDARFLFIQRRMTDEELAGLMLASDLVLFNFKTILNSGSVLTSLSLGRPVLAPNLSAIAETRRDLGSAWVRVFDGKLRLEDVETALGSADAPIGNVDLSDYAPDAVAGRHLDIYRGEAGPDLKATRPRPLARVPG